MDYILILSTIAGVVLLGCASPGANFITVTANALTSQRQGLIAAVGVASASTTWALIGVSGFAFVTEFFEKYTFLLRLIGGAYLIYIGSLMLMSILKSSAHSAFQEKANQSNSWRTWRLGYLVNMTNPKAALFYGSFFITILPQNAPFWLYASAVFVTGLISLIWHIGLALLFSRQNIRTVYLSFKKQISAVLGTTLIFLGARLAFKN